MGAVGEEHDPRLPQADLALDLEGALGRRRREVGDDPRKPLAEDEVAARPPGAQIVSLNGYAHDVDFLKLWAELVVLERFEPPTRRYAAGAAFFRAQRTPGQQGDAPKIVAIEGLDQAQRELGHLVVETRLPRIGASPSTSYEGDGFAILRHEDTEVVERALHRLVSLVRVRAA